MLIECTGYDPPALSASTTMMQPQATGYPRRLEEHHTARRTPPHPRLLVCRVRVELRVAEFDLAAAVQEEAEDDAGGVPGCPR
jgi:hypothetical protein